MAIYENKKLNIDDFSFSYTGCPGKTNTEISLDSLYTTRYKLFILLSDSFFLSLVQSCMRNDPTQTSCMFMRAVSHASVGQFYKAVKVMTRVRQYTSVIHLV